MNFSWNRTCTKTDTMQLRLTRTPANSSNFLFPFGVRVSVGLLLYCKLIKAICLSSEMIKFLYFAPLALTMPQLKMNFLGDNRQAVTLSYSNRSLTSTQLDTITQQCFFWYFLFHYIASLTRNLPRGTFVLYHLTFTRRHEQASLLTQ